jgi:hypothetical protein
MPSGAELPPGGLKVRSKTLLLVALAAETWSAPALAVRLPSRKMELATASSDLMGRELVSM